MSRLSDAEPTDIGERMKKLRGRVLTQQQLADAADVSVDLVRKLEQGARQTASIASLQRIARALDVDITDLLGRARTVTPTGDPDKGVTAIRRVITPVDDLLPDYGDAAQAVDLQTARRAVQYARSAYWNGHDEQLTAILPAILTQLRATVHTASTDEISEASEVLARGYWVTADTLVRLGECDAAWQCIRLALAASENGSDELLSAHLRGSVAWQLLTSGRFDEAHKICVRTAESVQPRGDVGPTHLSAYGSLILLGANAAGRDGRVHEAYHLVAHAGEVANRVGVDRTDYDHHFGPSKVIMQTVDVGVVTENYERALDAARRMPRTPGLPLALRCRHLADQAMALTRTGQQDRALEALLTAEAMGPDWITHQVFPRRIVAELLAVDRQSRLRELARRLDVVG